MAYRQVRMRIDGIDCAACAEEMKDEIEKLNGVKNVQMLFGIKSLLEYEVEDTEEEAVEKTVLSILRQEIGAEGKIENLSSAVRSYTYRIETIDCANCARELEEEFQKIPGVTDCSILYGISSRLQFSCPPRELERIETEMRRLLEEDQGKNVTMTRQKEQREVVSEKDDTRILWRLGIGAGLFLLSLFCKGQWLLLTALASYIVLGYDVLYKAVRGIGRRQLFDEHFLMGLATLAALYMGDFREAAGVMLFYQIGEYFQERAVARSRRSIGSLMDIRPEYAEVLRNGTYRRVAPEEVAVGETVRVKPGERVPLDGRVQRGSSSLNTASLTGEAKLRDVDVGDEVLSGAVNETGVLEIIVQKAYGDSTVARILELVENSATHKAKAEKFITRFARVYTPTVVAAAVVTAIITAFLTGRVNEGIARACTFLVISCPCALVISIPLSFFAGIGGLSSQGVLIKGATVIDSLAKVRNVVMDKTGTLTSGTFAVTEILHAQVDEKQLLHDAAAAEYFSNHPLAAGIRAANSTPIDETALTDMEQIAGRGIIVRENGIPILAGNARLLQERGIPFPEENKTVTLVYIARGGQYEGCLVLHDQIKEEAFEAVALLKKEGIHTVILSGDEKTLTQEAARALSVDEAIGGCLPADKVNEVQRICQNGVTAFVGDGVNDAPVIAAADVGFAMGGVGSDAAIEAADVVLMNDHPAQIALAIQSARRILRVANMNIRFAIGIKVLTLILGAFGYANMWMAIFADTGVAMLCVLNAMRLLRIGARTA